MKGHQGHFRELLPVDEVDAVVSCKLPKRCVCGEKKIKNHDMLRHQVYELPPNKAQHQYNDAKC